VRKNSPIGHVIPAADPDPSVWLLLGARQGDNRQVLALAEALDWRARSFAVAYNPLFSLPNRLLGASLASVKRCEPSLAPPWPDVVLAIGQRSVPVARWIKRQSGGCTKLVQLGRPRAPLDWFDLIVTTPQYGLPERANVLHNPLPLHGLTPAKLREAAGAWRSRLAQLPGPRIALLVGGPSWSYRFPVAAARRIAAQADDLARREGGSLLVTTSPRTPPQVADVLAESLAAPHMLYRWDRQRGADNPYLGFLALADRILVTEESISCLAEACSVGCPVTVLPLARRPGVGAVEALTAGSARGLFAQLAAAGIMTPPRNIGEVHRALVDRGLARWTPQGLEVTGPLESDHDPSERAVRRIRELLGLDMEAPPPPIRVAAAG